MKFKEIISETIVIDKDDFINTHGKNPKGYGGWAFKINGKTYFPPPDTLTNSIKVAIKKARESGEKNIFRVHVLP